MDTEDLYKIANGKMQAAQTELFVVCFCCYLKKKKKWRQEVRPSICMCPHGLSLEGHLGNWYRVALETQEWEHRVISICNFYTFSNQGLYYIFKINTKASPFVSFLLSLGVC